MPGFRCNASYVWITNDPVKCQKNKFQVGVPCKQTMLFHHHLNFLYFCIRYDATTGPLYWIKHNYRRYSFSLRRSRFTPPQHMSAKYFFFIFQLDYWHIIIWISLKKRFYPIRRFYPFRDSVGKKMLTRGEGLFLKGMCRFMPLTSLGSGFHYNSHLRYIVKDYIKTHLRLSLPVMSFTFLKVSLNTL